MQEAPQFVTPAEARKIIKGIKGRKTFALMVHAFMPTSENRGFEGSTCILVSQKVFVNALSAMLSAPFAEKGAKLRLYISPPLGGIGAVFISCH